MVTERANIAANMKSHTAFPFGYLHLTLTRSKGQGQGHVQFHFCPWAVLKVKVNVMYNFTVSISQTVIDMANIAIADKQKYNEGFRLPDLN